MEPKPNIESQQITIESLNYDVLVHIFKFLSKSDRISASETCRSWSNVANDHYFQKNKVVMFYNCILNVETLSPFHTFENTTVPYFHYRFTDINITDTFNNFWNKKGHNIRTLTLEYCYIRHVEFNFMLKKCTNLESLNIVKGCVDWTYETSNEDISENSLSKLKCIVLIGAINVTDALLARLLSAAPALEELNLSVSSLRFDPKLVGKFYPLEYSNPPSSGILTFYFVLQLIKSSAKNIKCLKFKKNDQFNSAAIWSLLQTENLKLETLDLRRINVDLKPLTTYQVFLKELCLNSCSSVTDTLFVDICENLVNLEDLDIARCYEVTDLGITKLPNLKKLKSLNISFCKKITQNGLIGGICADVNVTLEVLQVMSLNLEQNAVIIISERLPNLRKLNLGRCRKGVTDLSLQLIFKNQLLLHTLNISYCDEITDAGLTGSKILKPDEDYDSESSVKRVKVTTDIIYVGEQKLGTIFCAKEILDTGFSLSHLKHLKELNISNCSNITDVGLAHAFNLKSLIKLNLNSCEKLSMLGFACLVKNCPAIEVLSVLECNKLNHIDIHETVKCLRSLKQLQTRRSYIQARRPDNEIIFVQALKNHQQNSTTLVTLLNKLDFLGKRAKTN